MEEKQKKVLIFIDSLGSGGAQRQVANIAIGLKKNGYDVKVLVYLDNPFYKHILDDEQIPVVLCTGNKLFRLFRIRRMINKLKPNVVLAFLEGACFMACIAKIGHKRWKLITTERSAKESTFTSRRNKFFNKFD